MYFSALRRRFVQTKALPMQPATTPHELCRQQQQWAEQRYPVTGFLARLLAPQSPFTMDQDHLAGWLLVAVAALLDGTGNRPEGTVDNVAALATYPDLLLVLELLELELPKQKQLGGYCLPDLLLYSRLVLVNSLHIEEGRLRLDYAGKEVTDSPHQYRLNRTGVEDQLRAVASSLQEFFALRPPSQASIGLIAKYMQKFRQRSFAAPVPGDIWLKTPVSQIPIRALPANMSRYNNCYSQNKVVLGGAGTGRSLMMGRLCHAAHEKGNQVVMIGYRQGQGTMYQLAKKKGGVTREISTRSQASFNPFWFPERVTGLTNAPPSQLVCCLGKLLVCLLKTSSPQVKQVQKDVYYMQSLLWAYYRQRPWEASSTSPSFETFHEFATSYAAKVWAHFQNPALAFLTWLAEAGQPFYARGELSYLLKAQPQEVDELFTPKSRLLYFNLSVGHSGGELANEVVTQCISWLLLFGIDVHLGFRTSAQQEPFLTVALDELLDECLWAPGDMFMEDYLRTQRQNNQELICSWHGRPDMLFRLEHPVAHDIRNSSGCFILLNSGPNWHHNEGLWLTDQEKKQYESLQGRQVLITGLQEFSGIYDAHMGQEELGIFLETPE